MPGNAHLDEASGRTWLRLEWRALAAALVSDDPAASEALRDALSFRACRLAINPGAENDENALLLNEGLAEYTGVRLSGYSQEDQVKRTVNLLRAYDTASSFTRSFAYPTGPAYGLILDRADPDWRTHIAEGGDLVGALMRSIEFRPAGLNEDNAKALAERYGGPEIVAAEADRQAKRERRLAELKRMFITGPVLVVPMDGQTNFSFDPGGAESLPGYGTVYRSMRITGPFGVLETTVPVLWLTGGDAGAFRVSIDDVNALTLDGATAKTSGWTLTLETGWRLRRTGPQGNHIVERVE
jgi:hypothetical protein